MKSWYSSVYKAFIIGSVISFLISFFSTNTVSLGALLSGYSLLILGIMMILLILFNNILRITEGQSAFQIIYYILMTTGPFLLMLALIGFILYLIINYKNIITEGNVSHSYYVFSNIAIILFLLQIYLVYTNIDNDKFETTGKLSKVTSSLLYLLGVITSICAIILFTILKYFTTDGFTMKN